jgi:quercetin dioxygenase-like cupin family protein
MTNFQPDVAANVSRGDDRTKLLWAGGTVFDVILDGSQTDGSLDLLDQWGVRGDVTPLHIHHEDAEVFYVLEGGVVAWSGDDVHTLTAGDAVYLPPGKMHAFGIATARARIISVTAPTGFAAFVRAAGVPVTGQIPPSWESNLGAILANASPHGIEIVGPPPQLPAI